MRIKKEYLQARLTYLSNLIPPEDGYKYALENAPCYGGYRLVLVKESTGAHYGCFGGNGCEPRLSPSEMMEKLENLIQGVIAGRQGVKGV